jgi:hypothetical protein
MFDTTPPRVPSVWYVLYEFVRQVSIGLMATFGPAEHGLRRPQSLVAQVCNLRADLAIGARAQVANPRAG